MGNLIFFIGARDGEIELSHLSSLELIQVRSTFRTLANRENNV